MKINLLYNARLQQWWRPKAGILLALLLLSAIMAKPEFSFFCFIAILSITTLVGIASFGHLINDLGDIQTDALAGKPNAMANKTWLARWSLLGLCLGLAIVPWFFLPKDVFSLSLLGGEAFLLLTYALPPIRVKNKAYLAIIWDSLYAYVGPSILAFYTYTLAFNLNIPFYGFMLLGFWMLVMGIRHIVYHHVADRENDKKSNSANIALMHSKRKIFLFLQRAILPLELLTGLVFMGFLWAVDSTIGILSGISYLLSFRPDKLFHSHLLFSSHVFGKNSSDKFYSLIWLLVLAIYLSVQHIIYAWVLLFVVLMFSTFWINPFLETFKSFFHFTKTTLSSLVNYSIYYFRKFILRWSEEKNRGAYFNDWQKQQLGVIAVCNQNLNKYTETFVNGHHSKLPYKVEYYYGNSRIINHAVDGNILGKNAWLRELKEHVNKYDDLYFKRVLAENLQAKGVQLILSEFGTTGAYMQDVADMIGLPHICIFYGYDAWHKEVFNRTDYSKLFSSAQKIIGVSQDICKQLENLGCPKEKIAYLPCYLNVELFNRPKKEVNEPIFLSVGRFAETKSPHLTILAFNEVLKQIPDAQLRMIGKDGGGELFEACHILVKALGIADKVKFLGVLPPEEVAKEMQNARVFVQHSLTTPLNGDKEGTPVAIMEAMASGLPIVATKHAGIDEILEHNVSGVLVEEYDFLAMAKELIRVCEDTATVAKLGENARNRITDSTLISKHIQKLSAFVTDLLQDKSFV